jgi:hypothetical protein
MTDTSGAAFPPMRPLEGWGDEDRGLTKREYFAAHAPAKPSGWIAPSNVRIAVIEPRDYSYTLQVKAFHEANRQNALIDEVWWRWAYADAMLAARTDGETR